MDDVTPVDLVAGTSNWNVDARGVCFDFANLEKVDILLTFRCNAACAHCITKSNPTRREKLTLDEVLRILELGAAAGKRYMSFTGGEPFLNFELLLESVRYAKSLGYYVGTDTNAYWGNPRQRASDWVGRLVDAGLDAVFPSADAYHLPYVALDAVRNVIDACDEAGLACEVNFAPGPDESTNALILRELRLFDRGYFCDGLQLTGNDVEHLVHLFPHQPPSAMDDVGSMHMGVSPRGDVYANVDISYDGDEYVGTPLYLGNLRTDDLAALFERERSEPILGVTRTMGPSAVDAHLRSCPEIAGRYDARFDGRRYYSATEFWVDLFHSELAQDATRLLVDRAASAPISP